MRWFVAALIVLALAVQPPPTVAGRAVNIFWRVLRAICPSQTANYQNLFKICQEAASLANVKDAYLLRDGGIAIAPKNNTLTATAETLSQFCERFPTDYGPVSDVARTKATAHHRPHRHAIVHRRHVLQENPRPDLASHGDQENATMELYPGDDSLSARRASRTPGCTDYVHIFAGPFRPTHSPRHQRPLRKQLAARSPRQPFRARLQMGGPAVRLLGALVSKVRGRGQAAQDASRPHRGRAAVAGNQPVDLGPDAVSRAADGNGRNRLPAAAVRTSVQRSGFRKMEQLPERPGDLFLRLRHRILVFLGPAGLWPCLPTAR